MFNMQAKLLRWNFRDCVSLRIVANKKKMRNTKYELEAMEIIDLSKSGDVMMSFNCQTEREPVVAQGPSVAAGPGSVVPPAFDIRLSQQVGPQQPVHCAPGVTPI